MLGRSQPIGLLLAAALLAGAPHPIRPPVRPSPSQLLAAQPITPGGTLVREDGRLRTLELDELAPLRLRWSIPF